MLTMIFKMSAVTVLYSLLTVALWKRTNGKRLKLTHKLLIGGIYGLCCVLSTHFGIDFNHFSGRNGCPAGHIFRFSAFHDCQAAGLPRINIRGSDERRPAAAKIRHAG